MGKKIWEPAWIIVLAIRGNCGAFDRPRRRRTRSELAPSSFTSLSCSLAPAIPRLTVQPISPDRHSLPPCLARSIPGTPCHEGCLRPAQGLRSSCIDCRKGTMWWSRGAKRAMQPWLAGFYLQRLWPTVRRHGWLGWWDIRGSGQGWPLRRRNNSSQGLLDLSALRTPCRTTSDRWRALPNSQLARLQIQSRRTGPLRRIALPERGILPKRDLKPSNGGGREDSLPSLEIRESYAARSSNPGRLRYDKSALVLRSLVARMAR